MKTKNLVFFIALSLIFDVCVKAQDEYDVISHVCLTRRFEILVRRLNVGPYAWTSERIAYLRPVLKELEKNLPFFISQINKNGIHSFVLTDMNTTAAAYADQDSIILTSLLSASDALEPEIGHFKYGQVTVLHELAHEFDIHDLSLSKEFLDLVGFKKKIAKNDSYSYELESITSADWEGLKRTDDSIIDRSWPFPQQDKAILGAHRLFAHAHGFPSLYSIKVPMIPSSNRRKLSLNLPLIFMRIQMRKNT